MNHSISTTAGLVTAAAFAAVLATVAPAHAATTCSDGAVRCPASGVSPYAESLDALGGLTLAAYLASHVETRLAH